MFFSFFLLLITVTSSTSAKGDQGLVLKIEAGVCTKSDGSKLEVGMYTSSIQELIIDSLYMEVDAEDISGESFFNSSTLRYLDLIDGDYLVDKPLLLPSLFVLRLDDKTSTSLSLAGNASAAPTSSDDNNSLPALVGLVDIKYSAIIGGTIDARGHGDGWEAVRILDGSHNSIRSVNAISHVNEAWKSTITIRGGTRHELSSSSVDGDGVAGRCAWTIATNGAMIHDSLITGCVGHALDLDAYTSGSTAFSNTIVDNKSEMYGQGIFCEETASGNFIFNNTVVGNTNGIEIYSLTVGPVSSNIIANNFVSKNVRKGISSGGGNGTPENHAESNIFVGNKASGNGEGDFYVQHGKVSNEYWVSNSLDEEGKGDGEIVWVGPDPKSSANVSVFDP